MKHMIQSRIEDLREYWQDYCELYAIHYYTPGRRPHKRRFPSLFTALYQLMLEHPGVYALMCYLIGLLASLEENLHPLQIILGSVVFIPIFGVIGVLIFHVLMAVDAATKQMISLTRFGKVDMLPENPVDFAITSALTSNFNLLEFLRR